MKQPWWLLLFAIALLADLIAIHWNIPALHFATKPQLLLILMAFVFIQPFATDTGKGLLLAALFLSWCGDVFLLFDHQGSLFFIFGLLSFLLAHLFYIILFLKWKRKKVPEPQWNLLIFLPMVLYTGSLLYYLYPHLEALRIPVIIYATVLSSMFIAAAHAFPWKTRAGQWIIIGALLFVTSDSLLAINKFSQPFEWAGIAIMLTYGLAQGFIVAGLTKFMGSVNKS